MATLRVESRDTAMIRIATTVVVCLMLAGCTPEVRARIAQQQVAAQAAQAAADDEQCQAYGAKPGTDA